STVSLVYIDLDDFKAINDTYGHSAGDAILKEFAIRVKGHTRNTDIFSRFGGEEFILLIPNTFLATANKKAQKILQSISMEPFVIDGKVINVTSSIGVAEGNFNDNFNLDALISNADKALYSAKMNGKNRVEVYKL
ncbi:GGDEF domain-containing protein, partial [Vibrio rotiferianus]